MIGLKKRPNKGFDALHSASLNLAFKTTTVNVVMLI